MVQTRWPLRNNDVIYSGSGSPPSDDAGGDGEGKTAHSTVSQTLKHFGTDSKCQGMDCGHSTAEWN